MIFNTGESSTDTQIARLIEAINTNMAELRTDVQAQIAELERVISNSVGTVKSVQRGMIESATETSLKEQYKTLGSTTHSFYIDVLINPVNVNKTFVYSNTRGVEVAKAIPKLLNENTLRLYVGAGDIYASSLKIQAGISWQVVEFY